MLIRTFTSAALCVLAIGCGVETARSAKRTLIGVDKNQVLIAAQHTLAENGFDLEEVNVAQGSLKSSWKQKNRQKYQYEVTVALPAPDKGEKNVPQSSEVAVYEVKVSAKSQTKIIGGWSEPTPASSSYVDELLDDIVETTVSRFEPGVVSAPPEPSCTKSADCPSGQHCASGHCAAECSSSADCDTGRECDDRGRCVLPKPAPCPPPPPPPTVEKEEESKSKKRRRRRDRDDD